MLSFFLKMANFCVVLVTKTLQIILMVSTYLMLVTFSLEIRMETDFMLQFLHEKVNLSLNLSALMSR